jgi:DNA (cytosine-5)-methyltransferase 1
MLTLGSLFNGISGWILSAEKYGIKTLWESEIDDYCEAVTHYHYPDVKQLGDITKLKADDLEPVDIISAGSPCQGLSLSGKRKGLNDERSGLFVDSIKLVHELRKRTGKPRYFLWENVPGAFSTNKGNDFRAVLEEITKSTIPMPKDGRWAESGMVEWGGSQLAWRCMDSQWFGSAQRRKRIFLVADFRGHTAGEILFECKSSAGYSAESKGTREETATDVGASTRTASKRVVNIGFMPQMKAESMTPMVEKSPCLVNGTNPGFQNGVCSYDMTTHADEVIRPIDNNKMCTLNTTEVHDIGVFPQQSFDEYSEGKPLSTLKAQGGSYGGGSESLVYQKTVGALCMDDYKGANNQYVDQDKCVIQCGVRRLTPTECERLQNLPDGWTDVEYKGKPAPDSKRYKAIGNGMAQVCPDFIMKRISEVANEQKL